MRGAMVNLPYMLAPSLLAGRAHLRRLRRQSWLFLLVVCALGLAFNLSGIDLAISGWLADGSNGFPLRGHWLSQRVLHYYGGKLTLLLALAVIIFNVVQLRWPSAEWKVTVAGRYVFFSWLISFAIVGLLKQTTTLPCPWSLREFGGDAVYLNVFQLFSNAYPVGHCFPAGHATGAYGLLGLGFIALVFGHSMRLSVLLVLSFGALFSVGQLVRGAHFLSHDLFSIAICYAVAWLLAEFYLFPSLRRRKLDSRTKSHTKL